MHLLKRLLSLDGSKKVKTIKLIILIFIFVLLTVLFIVYSEEIKIFGSYTINKFGLPGLFVVAIILDVVLQIIPPDLLVFGFTAANYPVLLTSLVGGLGSVIGAMIGYGIGYTLEEEGIDRFIGRKKYAKVHELFNKYGIYAIMIGALTFVPFSAVCWSAGIFRMPFKKFVIVAVLTRIPRFMLVGYLGHLM